MQKIYRFFGGRKIFSGYLAFVILTVMAFVLNATFAEYAMYICVALGLTSGAVAWEDSSRYRNRGNGSLPPSYGSGRHREYWERRHQRGH